MSVSMPDPDGSRVVLIGTSTYEHGSELPAVPQIRRNVEALAGQLSGSASGIVPERNCTVLLDERDLGEIGRVLREARDEARDTLVVYYAGHGVVGGRRHELFLALRGTRVEQPGFGTALRYEELREEVRDSPARRKVIILDCCFAGRAGGRALASERGFVGQLAVEGSCLLMSTGPHEPAVILDGEECTAYTGRLIKVLRDGIQDGSEFIAVDSLHRSLVQVMRPAGLPRPGMHCTDNGGELAIARNPAFGGHVIIEVAGTPDRPVVRWVASWIGSEPHVRESPRSETVGDALRAFTSNGALPSRVTIVTPTSWLPQQAEAMVRRERVDDVRIVSRPVALAEFARSRNPISAAGKTTVLVHDDDAPGGPWATVVLYANRRKRRSWALEGEGQPLTGGDVARATQAERLIGARWFRLCVVVLATNDTGQAAYGNQSGFYERLHSGSVQGLLADPSAIATGASFAFPGPPKLGPIRRWVRNVLIRAWRRPPRDGKGRDPRLRPVPRTGALVATAAVGGAGLSVPFLFFGETSLSLWDAMAATLAGGATYMILRPPPLLERALRALCSVVRVARRFTGRE